jgi:hypothetical protein
MGNSGLNFQSEGSQMFRYNFRGAKLPIGQLRVLVEITTPTDQLWVQFLYQALYAFRRRISRYASLASKQSNREGNRLQDWYKISHNSLRGGHSMGLDIVRSAGQIEGKMLNWQIVAPLQMRIIESQIKSGHDALNRILSGAD